MIMRLGSIHLNTKFWITSGKMTKEQIGYSVYKHIEHHLNQFNVLLLKLLCNKN